VDIDKLIQLGKDGKFEELENERERLFQELMSTLPDDYPEDKIKKLEGLHFTTKNVRYQCGGNKIEAMHKSYDLMIESFEELNHLWQKLRQLTSDEDN